MEGFFVRVGNFIDDTIARISAGVSSGYASDLNSLFPAAVSLFLLYKGYQVLAGKIDSPISDLVYDVTGKVIIMAFVMNYGGYLDATLSAIDGIKEGFAGKENLFELLDEQLSKIQELAGKILDADSDLVPLRGWGGSVLVWVGGLFALLVTALILLVTTVTLKLLAITAPIFLFCLMWGWLRQMFNQWLQLICANILTILFISLVGRLGINFYNEIITQLSATTQDSALLTNGFIALCAGVTVGVFSKLSLTIGQNIATVSIEGAAAALTSSTAGRALKKAFEGGRGAWRFGRGMQNSSSNSKSGGNADNGNQRGLPPPSNRHLSYSERAGQMTGRAGRALVNAMRKRGGNS